jgi:hypothetical protein
MTPTKVVEVLPFVPFTIFYYLLRQTKQSCWLDQDSGADIIKGNVQTKTNFRKVDKVIAPLGFGLGPPNATVAKTFSLLTDTLFGAGFTQFLLDPNRAVDITPAAIQRKSCSQGIDVRGGQTCERSVFLAAGIDLVASVLVTSTTFPEADVWLVENHQGYVLHFTEGNRNWKFDNATECRVYHTMALKHSLGSFMMCVKNSTPNNLQARECSQLFVMVLGPRLCCFKPDVTFCRNCKLPIR